MTKNDIRLLVQKLCKNHATKIYRFRDIVLSSFISFSFSNIENIFNLETKAPGEILTDLQEMCH
jgi:hypothetical protein